MTSNWINRSNAHVNIVLIVFMRIEWIFYRRLKVAAGAILVSAFE